MTKHLIDRAFAIGPKLPKDQCCPSCRNPRLQLCRIEVKNKTGWVYYRLNDEGLDLDFTIEFDETDDFANGRMLFIFVFKCEDCLTFHGHRQSVFRKIIGGGWRKPRPSDPLSTRGERHLKKWKEMTTTEL